MTDVSPEALAQAREQHGQRELDVAASTFDDGELDSWTSATTVAIRERATVIELRRQLDSLACVGADYARLEAELATERQRAEALKKANDDFADAISVLPGLTRRDAIENARKAIIDLRASEAKRKALREACEDGVELLTKFAGQTALERLQAALAADGKDTP